MWVRLIGSTLLLGGCGLWAAGRTAAGREEVARIRGAADLFAAIGREIEAYCLPLDEIAAALPSDLRRVCAIDGNSVNHALEYLGGQTSDSEAAEILHRAATHLGQGGREDQITLCRDAARTLGACAERLTARYAQERRARRTLCVTGCLMMIILLW